MYVLFGKTLIYGAKSSDVGTNEMSGNGDDHKEAILLHGRRGQTVKGMAHQASDQSGSESRVSLSEVAGACGFPVSPGSTLPHRVRVTKAVEKRLTERERVKYAQTQE